MEFCTIILRNVQKLTGDRMSFWPMPCAQSTHDDGCSIEQAVLYKSTVDHLHTAVASTLCVYVIRLSSLYCNFYTALPVVRPSNVSIFTRQGHVSQQLRHSWLALCIQEPLQFMSVCMLHWLLCFVVFLVTFWPDGSPHNAWNGCYAWVLIGVGMCQLCICDQSQL